MASEKAKEKIEAARKAALERLTKKIEEGTVNSGELSSDVRELDFLKVLDEVTDETQ